jgi:diguanylate cyclase (GGDEF)-like protein
MSQTGSKATADNDRIELAIDNALFNQNWDLRFPPLLEDKFDAAHNKQRSKEIVFYGILAILVYDLFIVNDWLIRPEIIVDSIVWRGVATFYSLVILGFIYRGVEPKYREFLLTTAIVMATFCSCMVLMRTHSHVVTYDPFLFSLVFIASNTLIPLRIAHAVWSTLLNIGMVLLFVINHQYIDDDAIKYIVSFLFAVAIFSLFACYRLEKAFRQSYLLRLREQLHAEKARRSADEFQQLSQIDPLTQLPNRRAFETVLARAFNHESANNGPPLSVLMIDIDYFKDFNDSRGHLAGDECLRTIAATMKAQLRDSDFIARFGGEEFVVLLPRSDKKTTEITCERLRKSVADKSMYYERRNQTQFATISIGAIVATPKLHQSAEQIINLADQALYAAKGQGRNCWVLSETPAATRSLLSVV